VNAPVPFYKKSCRKLAESGAGPMIVALFGPARG
jgi:hypothetical protein